MIFLKKSNRVRLTEQFPAWAAMVSWVVPHLHVAVFVPRRNLGPNSHLFLGPSAHRDDNKRHQFIKSWKQPFSCESSAVICEENFR